MFDKLKKISASTHLKNPEKVVEWITEKINKRLDNPGYIEQLNEATKMIDKKLDVIFEEVGDITDLTNKRSYQLKTITSGTKDELARNITKAASQFVSETSLEGYKKCVQIKIINSKNVQYSMDLEKFRKRLQKYYDQVCNHLEYGPNIKAIDEIQIENGHGLLRYNIINNEVCIIK
ncbi:hypothetical protein BWK58_15490 [Flavobacterium columnare]|nr:hypothetical protein BWK58_15490 [Flavobacterium columnare]